MVGPVMICMTIQGWSIYIPCVGVRQIDGCDNSKRSLGGEETS